MRHRPIQIIGLFIAATANIVHDLARAGATSQGISGGASDWLPSTDGDLQTFANNFASVLTGAYVAYGISGSDATSIQALADAYSAAYDTATNPDTRTPPSIAAKDAAKNATKPELRRVGALIQANPAITDDQKLTIGLTVRDTTPTPISAPSTAPIISIIGATSLSQSLRMVDSATPTTQAKPAGAIAAEFRCGVSETPLTDPTAIPYVGLMTRPQVRQDFDSADVGKTAYYACRWITRTGLTGPWSNIASMTVAAAA